MRRRALYAVAVAGTMLLGGCGGSDEKQPSDVPSAQREVLRTIESLQTASRRGDAATICREIFTAALAESVRTASKHSCETEVKDRFVSPDAAISVGRGMEIKGSTATALIEEQNG